MKKQNQQDKQHTNLRGNYFTLPQDLTIGSNINPWYISGLTQSDGSFFCIISISKTNQISFRPYFTITADLDSVHVLHLIQNFFNCGKIYVNVKNSTGELKFSTREELITKIIPHFEKYPFYLGKLHSFKLLTQIVKLLSLNANIKGSVKSKSEKKILLTQLSLSMSSDSLRTSERLKRIFDNIGQSLDLIPNTNLTLSSLPSDEFIAGVLDGDGSFSLSFLETGDIKANMDITGNTNELALLEYIKKRLGNAGTIRKINNKAVRYMVGGLNQIVENIIPCLPFGKAKGCRQSSTPFWKSFTLLCF